MKAVCFIAIMLFMLFTVSSASAEVQTATLTDENSNIEIKEGIELPDGLLKVTVTYNPSMGVINYQYTGPTSYDGQHPYVTNPRFDEIAYNLNVNGAVSPGSWMFQGNTGMDGFGAFSKKYVIDGSKKERFTAVTVTLDPIEKPFPLFSSTGNAVAVHLAFDGAYDANNQPIGIPGYITLGGDGSTYLAGEVNQVPEFPTMVLPVAAILGLLFITQRRKEN